MRCHNMELDMILRGIVMTRGEMGATIGEMRSDYYDMIGESWPLHRMNSKQIIKYLVSIDGLMMEQLDTGLCIWYIDDIGSNVSEQGSDNNNNNIIVINDTSVAMTSALDNEQQANSVSYAIPPPRPRIVSSSFANANGQAVSLSSSTSDSLLIESLVNANCKRTLSEDSVSQQIEQKRQKLLKPGRLPLNEENLDIHNRYNGANSMLKQTTSTEIGNPITTKCDLNRCIMANDYIAPIKAPEENRMLKSFAKRCKIIEQPNLTQSESVASTELVKDHLFPDPIGIIGDDFMRDLISFELYGGDFTDENDEKFSQCISGQTIREARHLLLYGNQYIFATKHRYVIVNVGAIDILTERQLMDIETDYARLIHTITTIGLEPIITTIPKICINKNNKNYKCMYQTLLLFNQFLMNKYRKGYLFIDLFGRLFEPNQESVRKYYHNEPKTIQKGKCQFELWRWTEKGRKKIISAIEAFIETRLPE